MDFTFLGSDYADQVAEWNYDPSIREEGLRARFGQAEDQSVTEDGSS